MKTVQFFRMVCYMRKDVARVGSFDDGDSWDSGETPEIYIVKNGHYADVLNYDAYDEPMIVSSRMARDMINEGLRGVEFVKLNIRTRRSVAAPPFDYYVMKATGCPLDLNRQRIIDVRESDGRVSKAVGFEQLDSEIISGAPMPIRTPPGTSRSGKGFIIRVVAVKSSWDGSDVMQWDSVEEYGPFGGVVCTRKFVELAWRQKWSNIAIQPLDAFFDSVSTELRDCSWPPENWYPSDQDMQWRFGLVA